MVNILLFFDWFTEVREEIFTQAFIVKKNAWDKKTARLIKATKVAASYISNLDLIQRKAYEVFENLKYSGSAFTIDELTDRIKANTSNGLFRKWKSST